MHFIETNQFLAFLVKITNFSIFIENHQFLVK